MFDFTTNSQKPVDEEKAKVCIAVNSFRLCTAMSVKGFNELV